MDEPTSPFTPSSSRILFMLRRALIVASHCPQCYAYCVRRDGELERAKRRRSTALESVVVMDFLVIPSVGLLVGRDEAVEVVESSALGDRVGKEGGPVS